MSLSKLRSSFVYVVNFPGSESRPRCVTTTVCCAAGGGRKQRHLRCAATTSCQTRQAREEKEEKEGDDARGDRAEAGARRAATKGEFDGVTQCCVFSAAERTGSEDIH